MKDIEKREWKSEKKLRKAVKKMVKIKPNMLDFNTHIYTNGKKYFIRIWREDFGKVEADKEGD